MTSVTLDKSIFQISIDTELMWGVIREQNHMAQNLMLSNPEKSRKIFYDLINLFRVYDIPATWACVGYLFLEDWENCGSLINKIASNTTKRTYAATIVKKLFYGRDLVDLIISDRIDHEIGFHTLSHADFFEISREEAQNEIVTGMNLAKKIGISPISFVYPKNHIKYIELLKENSFRIFRGANMQRWNKNQIFPIKKINGLFDKFISPPVMPYFHEDILEIPSSLCFIDTQYPASLLLRANIGLNAAIASKKIYHIYFHPYDFLIQPDLFQILKKFLQQVAKKRDNNKLDILTMSNLTKKIKSR